MRHCARLVGWLIAAAAALSMCALEPAFAQSTPTYDVFSKGSITTAGADCSTATSCVVLQLGAGQSTCTVVVTGTWSATLQFEATVDGTTYFGIPSVPTPTLGSTVTSATANGQWAAGCGGLAQVRVRMSARTSGTASVSIEGGAGASATGTVTLAGTPAVNVSQWGGVAALAGNGVTGTGSPRVTVASDNTAFPVNQGTTGTAGVTMLNAVASTGAGTAYTNAAGYTAHDLQVTTTGGPTYTISLQGSLDNSNWNNIDTITSSTTTPNYIGSTGYYPYLRANLTALSGGTLTALYSGAINEAPAISIAGQPASKTGVQLLGVDLSSIAQNVPVDAAGAASLKAVAVQGIASGVPVVDNVTQFGGSNVVTGTGVGGVGIPRVTISNDSSLAANQSTNVAQLAGTATSTSNGAVDLGTLRVTIANNSTGQVALATGANVIGALTANQSVNVGQVNGITTSVDNGASGLGVQRVTLANNSTGTVGLNTGANVIGALTANQSVNTAQIAGTNTVTAGVAGLQAVGGNVANAVTATSNPVPVGGVFTTTPATLTSGQTATLQFDPLQSAMVNDSARTTGVTTEILVLNSASTAIPSTALTNRRAIEIQNVGPNVIWCKAGAAAVLNKSRRLGLNEAWSIDATDAITFACVAATADQVTGAATIVTELR